MGLQMFKGVVIIYGRGGWEMGGGQTKFYPYK